MNRFYFFCSLFFIFISAFLQGCSGPRAFTQGEYDDPTRVELLSDKFNENDMQQMADTVIKAMASCRSIKNTKTPPVVIVEKVTNHTQEHIDTVAMTDKIRSTLIQTGTMKFVDKEARGILEEEYKYNAGGNVAKAKAPGPGKQIPAQYILRGRLMTNVQELGKRKLVYYKLTMNLSNLKTNTIDCTEESQIRKVYEKHSYSD